MMDNNKVRVFFGNGNMWIEYNGIVFKDTNEIDFILTEIICMDNAFKNLKKKRNKTRLHKTF